MAMLDTDHDGKITKDEVLKHFAEVDANNDDAVTMDELRSHMREKHPQPGHGPQAGEHRPEKPGQPGPRGPEARGPGRGGPGFGGPGFGGPGFGGPGRGGPPSPAAMMERMDKNKDGKLTKDEFPPPAWEHFSKADANDDGVITAEELEAFVKTQRPGRPAADEPKTPETKPEAAPEKPAESPKQAEADFAPADAISVLPAA